MDVEHLVKMANQIGQFYQTLPDHAAAVSGTANHIRRFWDPRMRRAILAHLDAHGGDGLDPLVVEAVRTNRSTLEPPGAALSRSLTTGAGDAGPSFSLDSPRVDTKSGRCPRRTGRSRTPGLGK